jgi:hypothetical protein
MGMENFIGAALQSPGSYNGVFRPKYLPNIRRLVVHPVLAVFPVLRHRSRFRDRPKPTAGGMRTEVPHFGGNDCNAPPLPPIAYLLGASVLQKAG